MRQIFMVSEDEYFVWRAYQKMLVVFQAMNHPKEFSIPNIVISFGLIQRR